MQNLEDVWPFMAVGLGIIFLVLGAQFFALWRKSKRAKKGSPNKDSSESK